MRRTLDDALVSRFEGIVGAAHVLTDPDVVRTASTDWTGRFRGDAPAVVRPADEHEVAAVVRLCAETGTALVPQGGNTGLVGGSVPLAHEVVLALTRLREVSEVDGAGMQMTAGAGVTLRELQERAGAVGCAYAVDLAARDAATVGGMVATNAGGVHFVRFGGTRQQLLGVSAVLGDGSVVSHLGGLAKDNTGYDLTDLLCGSEGTLGVVTAARLRLVPRFERVVTALVAFDSVAAAVDAVMDVRRRLDCLDAAEMFFADGLDLVCSVGGLPRPFRDQHPVYVLLEAADHRDPTDRLADRVAASDARDAAVATDAGRRAELWAYREQHTLAINTVGTPHKLDVTVPPLRLKAFIDEVRPVVAALAPSAHAWLFGHVADGNVHVNVTGAGDTAADRVDQAVLELVAGFGGSISAEHGIGTAKKRWLHLNRSSAEIAAFRRLKHALDPQGILNPNVLLP